MRKNLLLNNCLLLFFLTMQAHILSSLVLAQEHINTYETSYATINYRNEEDLKKLYKKLKGGFGISFRGNNNYRKELRGKVDDIFRKTRYLLGMRSQEIRVNINLYPDQRALNKAYLKLCGGEEKFVAFYVYRLNTIFITAENINGGILAHEMTHCFVNHYFTKQRPPRRIGELLGQHVSLHLYD